MWRKRQKNYGESVAIRALRIVEDAGFQVALVGGWSRELLGLEAPREHGDIDLLVTNAPIPALDEFLGGLDEIKSKRFAHKRAFRLDGVMVELILVERRTAVGSRGRVTDAE